MEVSILIQEAISLIILLFFYNLYFSCSCSIKITRYYINGLILHKLSHLHPFPFYSLYSNKMFVNYITHSSITYVNISGHHFSRWSIIISYTYIYRQHELCDIYDMWYTPKSCILSIGISIVGKENSETVEFI